EEPRKARTKQRKGDGQRTRSPGSAPAARSAGRQASGMKRATPSATSSPAKKNQREITVRMRFVPPADRAAVGGARPAPTANANTPSIVCPSSESTLQRTV